MTDAERNAPPAWPPPWPSAHPPEPTPPSPTTRRRTAPTALALAGVVALLAGAAGAAAGISVADRSPDASSSSAARTPDAAAEGSRLPESVELPRGDSNPLIDVGAVANRASPAIVNIASTTPTGDQGAGSGMVVTRSGQVLTNSHVISGATEIEVEVGVTGETYSADVLGYDVEDDVALLQLEDAEGMATIRTAPATSASVGDPVVAIGNALGRFGTPSAVGGTIAALGQDITAGDGFDRERLLDMIRVAARIQPGDSGGALLDEDGRVIGMNTAASLGSGGYGDASGGTGFAIPIDRALTIADEIRDGDASNGAHIGPRAMLGVVLTEAGGGGAAVGDVAEDSPAADAGVGPGDTITAVDGEPVSSATGLRAALARHGPGDRVSVSWIDSGGIRHGATVTLVEGPPG